MACDSNTQECVAKGAITPIPTTSAPNFSPCENDPFLPFTDPGAGILFISGVIGIIGNLTFILIILLKKKHRKISNAFLLHHSFLDLFKAIMCIVFSYMMVGCLARMVCNVIGVVFLVTVTTYAFNHLGLIMNEAYQFADLTLMVQDSRNACCVSFGIFITWFSSMILNLGIAFIPGNPLNYPGIIDYAESEKTNRPKNKTILAVSTSCHNTRCDFICGITGNYVLQVLWVLLITMAIILSALYLRKLHLDIKRSSYYRLTTLIRATVSIDPKVRTASQRRRSQEREKHYIKQVEKFTLRNFYLLSSIVLLFGVLWYPLLILTMVDISQQRKRELYIILTVIAWSHPLASPMLYMCFLWNPCCCPKVDLKPHHVEDAIKNREEMERNSSMEEYEKSYIPEDNFGFDRTRQENESGYRQMALHSPAQSSSETSEAQSKRVAFWNVEV